MALPIVRAGRVHPPLARQILARGEEAEPTYDHVGATLDPAAPVDLRSDRRLGRGDEVFARARDFLRRFGPQRAVAEVWPPDATVEDGGTMLVVLPLGPVTLVAVNRVVGVVEEPGRWGFAYGSLPGHPEAGEEAFVVERRGDEVVGRIAVRAHPAVPAGAALDPLLRPVQRRFVRRYLDALAAAAAGGS